MNTQTCKHAPATKPIGPFLSLLAANSVLHLHRREVQVRCQHCGAPITPPAIIHSRKYAALWRIIVSVVVLVFILILRTQAGAPLTSAASAKIALITMLGSILVSFVLVLLADLLIPCILPWEADAEADAAPPTPDVQPATIQNPATAAKLDAILSAAGMTTIFYHYAHYLCILLLGSAMLTAYRCLKTRKPLLLVFSTLFFIMGNALLLIRSSGIVSALAGLLFSSWGCYEEWTRA